MEYEYHFLKAPVEQWQAVLRSQARALERDFLVVENAMKTLSARERESPSVENTVSSLERVLGRLCGMKRKLTEGAAEADRAAEVVQARVQHLQSCDPAHSTNFRHSYNVTRDFRVVSDYVLRRGCSRTAEFLAQKCHLVDLVDIETFRVAWPIIEGLQAHRLTEALAWCKENQARLKRAKSGLEFSLRLQEFLQKARSGPKLAALEYARKHLTPFLETNAAEIKHALGAVLLSRGDPTLDRYKDLLDEARWAALVEAFKVEFFALSGLAPIPTLHVALQAGVLALNTQQAHQVGFHHVNDPMGNKLYQGLARRLPQTYRMNSCLVCRLSGAVMDSNNPPLVLPNGYVYSYQALSEMFHAIGGIECPVTHQRYSWDELRKAFVL
eukprot:RCo005258